MSMGRVIDKYVEAIMSDVFVDYEKGFAQRVVSALSAGYRQGKKEPPLVQIVEDVVNSVHGFVARNNKTYFELSTKSIFVHGNKSQVEFDFYGQKVQRELCDLVFTISVVLNGRKYFEKITLNQFKKDKTKHRSISWSLDNRAQLYLLSRFPSFKGIRGSLIPSIKHNLPNYSGCLGSYGLLYRLGDFAFVSGTKLGSFIGDKKTLKIAELYDLANGRVSRFFAWFSILAPQPWDAFGNCHFCPNVFSFVDQYLRMNIGEPVFMAIGFDNPQARNFVHELMHIIESKAKKENDQRMLDLTNGFHQFSYKNGKDPNPSLNENPDFDPEGGGIGIIHTTINLGEI